MKTDSTLKFKKQLDKIISHYSAINDSEYIVTDFHIIVNPSTGSFQILNDDEFVLASDAIDEWAIEKDNSKTAESIQNDIKNQLEELNKQDFFNSLNIYKPFSFLFENEDNEILSELFVVSDEEIIVSEELLKGLDEELNEFINKLLNT